MQRFLIGLLTTVIVVGVVLLAPVPVAAQGAAPLLDDPLEGCYDVAVYGVGLFGAGVGAVELMPPGGPVVAAYLEWVGAEDITPGGLALDGTSTLTVNGQAIVGTLAAPFDGIGNAGYDPNGFTNAGPKGWFAWHAAIGPDGAGIIPANMTEPLTLDIRDWDSPALQTNGATVTLIFAPERCRNDQIIQFQTGVNWYFHNTPNAAATRLLVYPVAPEPIDRAARMYFSHAGTDKSQDICRGGAVWMMAGQGASPAATAFDLLATGDTDGDGTARGYGINGGVEILNDPFTSAALPCVPAINPTPDEPYAAGHPYPGGALDAPYRALAMNPPTGGDVGEPGEWGIVEATVRIPANATWVAFQLESEADQSGESGSWVGGGVFVVLPTAAIGDRVWDDLNANGLQDAGEPGVAAVAVTLLDHNGVTVATTETDADGRYGFADLVTGDYAVAFTLPAGYRFAPANVETGPDGDAGDSDADPASGWSGLTHLDPGEVDLTWDAGLVRLLPAIAIEKLPDLQQVNYGGDATFTIVVRNTGELDLFDVTVTDPLAPACDRFIGDLPVAGEVTYTCVAPAVLVDFTNVATVVGTDAFDRAVTDDDDAVVDVLPLIRVDKAADPVTVPVEGGPVTFIVQVTNLVDEPLVLHQLVDDVFGDLRGRGTCALPQTIPVGGTYECRFNEFVIAPPFGHVNVVTGWARDDEGNETSDDDDATVLPVAPSASSSVGDLVWVDRNANGLQEAGEEGVPGVLVTLYRRDGNEVGNAITDANGLYLIKGLEAGDYYLEFFVPNASGEFTNFTQQDAGADDLIDSDVNQGGLSGRTVVFNLGEDEEDLSWDAGLLVPTSETPTEEPALPPQRLFLPLLTTR